jgi:PKHD-type hydroxylase
MDNLNLLEIDLSAPPEFNNQKFSYWQLKSESLPDYVQFDSVFSIQEIKHIIKLGKSFIVDQSKTMGGTGFSEIRKSMNSWIPPCDLTVELYKKIQSLIEQANQTFDFDLRSIENLQFTIYNEKYQGHYGAHIDKFENPGQPGSHRKLSFSIQLTDPTKYEGGDLLIYTSKNPMVANKNIGTINFFPSYTLHEVTPVTKGERMCLVGWVSGPKFK